MTHHSLFAGSLLALALTLQPAAAFAQPGSGLAVPDVPANLAVPGGHTAYLATRATGTQNYICMPVPTGVAWKFLGPQATLFISALGFDQQISTHFLSANPAEQGLARPTWQHSFDTSSVWGRVVASSADPNRSGARTRAWPASARPRRESRALAQAGTARDSVADHS